MVEKPKVSIITVTYNSAATVEQTIKSVIGQDYENIEYIMIDGASADGTCEIIEKYHQYIDIFISESDEGLYYAMNKGIMHASGEIIGIINSDDFYVSTAVGKVADYYSRHDVDVVYGNCVWFNHSEKTRPYICRDIKELWYGMALPHPAVFVKREIYIKYGIFDTSYFIAADYDLMLRFYIQGVRFGHMNENLAYFRDGGISFRKNLESIRESRKISLNYIDQCDEKEKWMPKIHELYAVRRFAQFMMEDEKIYHLIGASLYKKIKNDHTVIFGTGIWGERCFRLLRAAGVHIDFIVDNNMSIWGNRFYDLLIKSPSDLHGYKGNILIATYQYEKDIMAQLKLINNLSEVVPLSELAQTIVYDCENGLLNDSPFQGYSEITKEE